MISNLNDIPSTMNATVLNNEHNVLNTDDMTISMDDMTLKHKQQAIKCGGEWFKTG